MNPDNIEYYDDKERYPKGPIDNWESNLIRALAMADCTHKEKLFTLMAIANTEWKYAQQDGQITENAGLHDVAYIVNENIEDVADELGFET